MSNANKIKDGFVVGPVSRKRSTKPIDAVDELRGESDSRDDDDEHHTYKGADKPFVISPDLVQMNPKEADLQEEYIHTGGYQHKDFPSYIITGYRLRLSDVIFHFCTSEGGVIWCETDWLPRGMRKEIDRLEDLYSTYYDRDVEEDAATLTYGMLRFGKALTRLTNKPVQVRGADSLETVDCANSAEVNQYWTKWVLEHELVIRAKLKEEVSSDASVLRALENV